MAKDLHGHPDRYKTYAELRQRIEHDTFTQTSGSAPMLHDTEIAPQTEVPGGDSENPLIQAVNALANTPKGKGKGKQEWKPKPDKGKGKGKDRICWRCGKTGHAQHECRGNKDKTGAPLAKGDRNRFRPIHLQHLEEQIDEEEEEHVEAGSLEACQESWTIMEMNSCEECPDELPLLLDLLTLPLSSMSSSSPV